MAGMYFYYRKYRRWLLKITKDQLLIYLQYYTKITYNFCLLHFSKSRGKYERILTCKEVIWKLGQDTLTGYDQTRGGCVCRWGLAWRRRQRQGACSELAQTKAGGPGDSASQVWVPGTPPQPSLLLWSEYMQGGQVGSLGWLGQPWSRHRQEDGVGGWGGEGRLGRSQAWVPVANGAPPSMAGGRCLLVRILTWT